MFVNGMRKTLVAVFAAAMVLPAFSAANAEVYHKREHINRDKCYKVKKVPALVEYDTRGIKVRDSSRSWKGNFHKDGSIVRDKYHQDVYIQTRRVVEREHTTLVPVKCR